MGIKELIEVRKTLKAKKPEFLRQNALIKKKVSRSYRKPRGCSSRMRTSLAGYPPKVSQGYQSPKLVKGLNNDGLKIVIIDSLNKLNKVDKVKDIVVISSKVGNKKALALYSEAKKLGLKVENYDDNKSGKIKSDFEKRKELRTKKDAKKVEKEKIDDKKVEKEKKDANEEKKEEVKEKEKIVIDKKTAM
jgi:large subunit ribosomal protein L32e